MLPLQRRKHCQQISKFSLQICFRSGVSIWHCEYYVYVLWDRVRKGMQIWTRKARKSAGDAAEWEDACLGCVRTVIQSPAREKQRDEGDRERQTRQRHRHRQRRETRGDRTGKGRKGRLREGRERGTRNSSVGLDMSWRHKCILRDTHKCKHNNNFKKSPELGSIECT